MYTKKYSLLICVPKRLLDCLQSVLNAAAWLLSPPSWRMVILVQLFASFVIRVVTLPHQTWRTSVSWLVNTQLTLTPIVSLVFQTPPLQFHIKLRSQMNRLPFALFHQVLLGDQTVCTPNTFLSSSTIVRRPQHY